MIREVASILDNLDGSGDAERRVLRVLTDKSSDLGVKYAFIPPRTLRFKKSRAA